MDFTCTVHVYGRDNYFKVIHIIYEVILIGFSVELEKNIIGEHYLKIMYLA